MLHRVCVLVASLLAACVPTPDLSYGDDEDGAARTAPSASAPSADAFATPPHDAAPVDNPDAAPLPPPPPDASAVTDAAAAVRDAGASFVCAPEASCTCDPRSGVCQVKCSDGAQCETITCAGARSCSVECSDRSSCTIDCSAGGQCQDVRCTGGSSCLLVCGENASCAFKDCSGEKGSAQKGAVSCGGGVIACNRGCP